jgi:hypothetical protein
MINNVKKCNVNVLLVIKNAFKRVFIFININQNNISYPRLRNYKISKFKK